nr:MAG TPA: hypothetical protein [Caudoviricetes sp.]
MVCKAFLLFCQFHTCFTSFLKKNKKRQLLNCLLIARRMAHESRLSKKYLGFPKTLNFHSNLL